jgi:ABC-type spermidine/putrescine transport system permease subunit II
VSAVIRIFGWIVILGRKGLVNKALAAFGLEPVRLLYSDTAVVTAGLVGMDSRLEEAAMSLGATRVQAFFRVTLPLLRSSLLSGAIFAFIISFSDINLALFLSGPQSTSLPVHIFSQIQWQGDPTIAAASTLQILIIGLLILVVQRLFRLRLLV